MNTANSLKSTNRQTLDRHRNSYHKESDSTDFSRRYDCEEYLDCLTQASLANMSGLPCTDCNRYVSRGLGADGDYDVGIWT